MINKPGTPEDRFADYRSAIWEISHGQLDEKPAVVSRNTELESAQRADRPYTLLVSLEFAQLDGDRLPNDAAEIEAVEAAEEDLADLFVDDCGGWYGLHVTSDGTRDFFFFLPEKPEDSQVEDAIDQLGVEFEYDFWIEHDPEWLPYNDLS